MKRVLTGSLALGLALTAAAPGGDAATSDERQERQQDRIEQGIKSGELTKREAARLERQEAKIAAEEKAFRSDGKLSVRERAKLQRDLNKTSRHIYRQKHDAQTR